MPVKELIAFKQNIIFICVNKHLGRQDQIEMLEKKE